jgi:hypothetical protein
VSELRRFRGPGCRRLEGAKSLRDPGAWPLRAEEQDAGPRSGGLPDRPPTTVRPEIAARLSRSDGDDRLRAMTPAADPRVVCFRCSKPIRHDSVVLWRRGAPVHLTCRTRKPELQPVERVDRAELARARSVRLLNERKRLREQLRMQATTCALCGQPATVTNWRPQADWYTIDDCACRGFFVWAPLFKVLPQLSAEDRETLSRRIRELRARTGQAWLTTREGTPTGSLVIHGERPDRPR